MRILKSGSIKIQGKNYQYTQLLSGCLGYYFILNQSMQLSALLLIYCLSVTYAIFVFTFWQPVRLVSFWEFFRKKDFIHIFTDLELLPFEADTTEYGNSIFDELLNLWLPEAETEISAKTLCMQKQTINIRMLKTMPGAPFGRWEYKLYFVVDNKSWYYFDGMPGCILRSYWSALSYKKS